METIVWVYLVFIFLSLYLTMLIVLLYIRNHKTIFNDKVAEHLKTLTIAIPAYNEEGTIGDTIRAIQAIDYPKELVQIIVVNDGSTDSTLDVIKQFKGITIINQKNGGKANAMNAALRMAKGEIFVTTDADSYPTPDSFKKMITYFDDEKTGGVTSATVPKDNTKLFVRMQTIEYFIIAFARKLFDYVSSVHVTPGPLSMFKTETLRKLGGFDEKNITEDIEIGWRMMNAGYRNRMCLSARVYTSVPYRFKNWWNQRLRWNIGGFQTLYKYRKVLFNFRNSTLGMFVAPRFLISYILSITGFLIFAYLGAIWLKVQFMSSKLASETGVSQMALHKFYFTPTVFTFFIIVFFIITFVYTIVGLRAMNKGKLGVRGNLITVFAYLLLYLILFPPVLMHSIYAMTTKNIKWYK